MKDVSLIVLCVGMLDMTKRCVELIKQHTPPVYDLVIVADACDEEMLKWLHTLDVIVIANSQPVGTPTALNLGIRGAGGYLGHKHKYFALVNNDISVSPNWFEPLKKTLDSHKEYGWVASRILRGDTIMDFGVISSTLISGEAIDKVGLFDERLSVGIGWEDNDYLLRFWLAGYDPHGVRASFVYHPPHATTLMALHGAKCDEKYALAGDIFMKKWGLWAIRNIDWTAIPVEEG